MRKEILCIIHPNYEVPHRFFFFLKKVFVIRGIRKMTQWLTTLVLVEDVDSIPRTYIIAHNHH